MATSQDNVEQRYHQILWLGVAGIELRANGQILVIDPFVTRPPLRRVLWGHVRSDAVLVAKIVPQADFVLVTHAHWDHVMDVPAVIEQTRATAYGSPNTCRLLSVLGVTEEHIREIKVGDQLMLGRFQVKVIQAEHGLVLGRPFATGSIAPNLQPPLRLRNYRMDDCFSFLIEVDGLRFLDWSSERIDAAPIADVLFAKPLREQAYYEALLELVRPRVIIPIHWDDFMRPLSQPLRPMLKQPRLALPPIERVHLEQFSQMIKCINPEIKVFLPEIFHLYGPGEFV